MARGDNGDAVRSRRALFDHGLDALAPGDALSGSPCCAGASGAMISIRVLTPSDLAAYRALHRFGLKESPTALADTLAIDAARPDSVVEEAILRGEIWGA